MKLLANLPALVILFVLFFSVNLWAEEKAEDIQQNSNKQSTSNEPKKLPDIEKTKNVPPKPETEDKAKSTTDTRKGDSQTEQDINAASWNAETDDPPSASEYWINKLDQLVDSDSQAETADINALYGELTLAFDHYSQVLKKSLSDTTDDVNISEEISAQFETPPYLLPNTQDELYNTLQTLYSQRFRLWKQVSVEIREELTGTGVEGVQELTLELTFLLQTLRYRINALPQLGRHILDELRIAPLPMLGRLLQLVFALVVFHYWRRWAPDGLTRMRQALLNSHPRQKSKHSLAKVIWYFDQLKSPIAWLLLVALLFSFAENPAIMFFIEVAKITAIWVLFSWMGVLFLNALISRSSNSIKPETAALTLRSLKYFGTWIVICGLSLDLVSRYTGKGTLYEWVHSASEVVLLLLLALLISRWQATVRQGIRNEPQGNSITEAMLQHNKGLVGYLYTILGIGYLSLVHISTKFIDCLSYFQAGQQALDSMIDLEIAKAYQRQKDEPDARPLSPELEDKLKHHRYGIKHVGSSILQQLLHRTNSESGGAVVLVGETGGGKSVLMRRVSKETEKKTILVSCPKEGLDALINELARALHIDSESPKRHVVFKELRKQEIEVLLIDNIHMLIRPYLGGQEQLDKLAELFEYTPNILCVVSTNSASWQYYLCVRAQRILDKNALILKPWTIDQIATLIRNSCDSAGIDPDFSRIVIPRQFDNNNYDDPKERAFSGFTRILHGAAAGNPAVALGLWVKSLYTDKSGQVVARLPRLPASEELDNASLATLLVLRVICQSEIITREDILKSLQVSNREVAPVLLMSQRNQWVDVIDGKYYQLNWYWRKAIMRILTRQNLMSRSF